MAMVVIPMAFESQGAMHPNWRATYESWAHRWATLGEGRSRRDEGALVRCWVAQASMAIQRAQYFLVRRMRELAESCAHGGQPHAWQGVFNTPDGTLYVGDRTGTIFRVTDGQAGESARHVEAWAQIHASVAAFHLALGPDGALRKADPYTDGALRKADPYTDGALAGKRDPFTDGL